MAKFKTENFHFFDHNERNDSDVLTFTSDIFINSKGKFYTNLDRDVIAKFKKVGIDCGKQSRNYEDGFFEADTFEGLKSLIRVLGNEYVTKEIVSTIYKIEYSIETDCHYVKTADGVFPNGYYVPNDIVKENGGYWREGTVKYPHSDNTVYSLQIYAKPFLEIVYKYKSGKTFTKKIFNSSSFNQEKIGENWKWLSDVIRQKKPPYGTLREIEYTEAIAGFFRGLFEHLFWMNERIRGKFTPESVRELASAQSRNLLTGGEQ